MASGYLTIFTAVLSPLSCIEGERDRSQRGCRFWQLFTTVRSVSREKQRCIPAAVK